MVDLPKWYLSCKVVQLLQTSTFLPKWYISLKMVHFPKMVQMSLSPKWYIFSKMVQDMYLKCGYMFLNCSLPWYIS